MAVAGNVAVFALAGDGVKVVQVFEELSTPAPVARPKRLVLEGNRPNPFNPSTRIAYTPANGRDPLSLTVYDVAGRRVRELFRGVQPATRQEVAWAGRDDAARIVASGVYLYAVEQSGQTVTGRMVLIK